MRLRGHLPQKGLEINKVCVDFSSKIYIFIYITNMLLVHA
jgi:hypothetical protein